MSDTASGATPTGPEADASGGSGPAAPGTPAPKNETKGERTRRRLLELAVDHFGRLGYRGASVSEICRAAGLTQAASYTYFESKEHLFRAAVDVDAQTLIDTAREAVAAEPASQLLPSLLVHLAVGLETRPLIRRVLSGQEPEAMAELRRLPVLEAAVDDLAIRLGEGQATGEVRTDVDPVALARGAQTLLLALLTSLTQSGGPVDGETDAAPVDAEIITGVLAAFDAMVRPPSGQS